MKSFEDQIVARLRALSVVAAVVAVATGVGIGLATYGLLKVGAGNHQTCVVQARGLPAGKHLAKAVGDIGLLLAPETAAQMRAKGVPESTISLLLGLRRNAVAYAAIEAKQPASRSC